MYLLVPEDQFAWYFAARRSKAHKRCSPFSPLSFVFYQTLLVRQPWHWVQSNHWEQNLSVIPLSCNDQISTFWHNVQELLYLLDKTLAHAGIKASTANCFLKKASAMQIYWWDLKEIYPALPPSSHCMNCLDRFDMFVSLIWTDPFSLYLFIAFASCQANPANFSLGNNSLAIHHGLTRE